jgi:rhodanese-related sulfurtransferase
MKGDTDMPTTITRDEVRALLARGAQLVGVMSPDEYAEEHLPGAINLFIKTLDAASAAQLRRDAAVIVYCYDLQ